MPPGAVPWWSAPEGRLMWKALLKQIRAGVYNLIAPEQLGENHPEPPTTFPVWQVQSDGAPKSRPVVDQRKRNLHQVVLEKVSMISTRTVQEIQCLCMSRSGEIPPIF